MERKISSLHAYGRRVLQQIESITKKVFLIYVFLFTRCLRLLVSENQQAS